MRLPSTTYVSLYCKLYSTNRNLSWKKKKKTNPIPWIQAWHLESELFGLCEIHWKSEFSWKHSRPALDRGRDGGGSPSTLFFHSYFSRLVWTPSSVPPFHIKISWEGLNASNLKLEFLGLRDLPKALYFHLSTYTHTHTHPELDFILILQQILRVGLKRPLRKKGVGRLYWKKKKWSGTCGGDVVTSHGSELSLECSCG